jgi:hypothetical protein
MHLFRQQTSINTPVSLGSSRDAYSGISGSDARCTLKARSQTLVVISMLFLSTGVVDDPRRQYVVRRMS